MKFTLPAGTKLKVAHDGIEVDIGKGPFDEVLAGAMKLIVEESYYVYDEDPGPYVDPPEARRLLERLRAKCNASNAAGEEWDTYLLAMSLLEEVTDGS